VRRGISPVITSTLLVLVSIAVVAIFYTWATASTTQVASAIYSDAEAAQRRILASVKILAPPPINPWDSNMPVVIHNNGVLPLTNFRVYYIPPKTTVPVTPSGKYIDASGNIVDIAPTDWPIETVYPGDAVVIWLPEGNYNGYTIVVVARNFEKTETVGVVG